MQLAGQGQGSEISSPLAVASAPWDLGPSPSQWLTACLDTFLREGTPEGYCGAAGSTHPPWAPQTRHNTNTTSCHCSHSDSSFWLTSCSFHGVTDPRGRNPTTFGCRGCAGCGLTAMSPAEEQEPEHVWTWLSLLNHPKHETGGMCIFKLNLQNALVRDQHCGHLLRKPLLCLYLFPSAAASDVRCFCLRVSVLCQRLLWGTAL